MVCTRSRVMMVVVASAVTAGACASARTSPPDERRAALGSGPQQAEGQTVAEMFTGKFPGVQVFTGPGGGISLRIRGAGTLYTRGEPLYIIDGTPVTTGADGLLYINPAEIHTIEVLKDTGSLAFYGVRGANGVVLITTKRRL